VAKLFTIGHSTRALSEFIDVLRTQQVEALVDIRAFPVSRRFPHFGRLQLEPALSAIGISYLWVPSLGGHRAKLRNDSPNIALRNAAFQNYADYMLSPEFEKAARQLAEVASPRRTAFMCAEKDYRQCHRKLVSDWLVAHGHEVLHIEGPEPAVPHTMTSEARLEGQQLIYRGDRLL